MPHSLLTPKNSAGTAAQVHERLLNDRVMRHNQPRKSRTPEVPARLSPAEQEQQAREVAGYFPHHYLDGLHYSDTDGMAVALVRPYPGHSAAPHQIKVDASGNMVIITQESAPLVTRHSGWLMRMAGLAILVCVMGAIFIFVWQAI